MRMRRRLSLSIDPIRELIADLAYDQATGESEDHELQLELCVMMWWFRHMVLAVALVAALLDGRVGSGETLVVAALSIDVVGHVIVRRIPQWASIATVTIALALIGFALAGLSPLLVFLLGVATLGWAASFRPAPAIASYAGVMVAVLAAYNLGDARVSGATATGAFCVLAMVFTVRSIRFNIAARRASQQQRRVADGVEAILWEQVPADDVAMRVSAAAERVLGYPATAWEESGFCWSVLHPDDFKRVRDEVVHAAIAQRDHTFTCRVRHADGSYRWMENQVSSVRDRGGKHVLFVGSLTDRTQEIEARGDAELFGGVVASSPIGHLLLACGEDGPVIEAANDACRQLICGGEDSTGQRFEEVLEREGGPRPLLELVTLLHGAEDGIPATIEFRSPNDRSYQATARRMSDHICSIDFIDMTERVEAARLLEEQALRDDLTGLPNRRYFVEALESQITSGSRTGTPTTILMIDLDDFKEINDSLGHETGDQLLCSIADRMRASFDAPNVLARLGGDEFAVVLAEVDATEGARRAEELIALICQPVMIGDLQLRVRASVGVAGFPEDAVDPVELMRRADVAMYQAKSRRIGHQLYDACSDPFGIERVTLVSELEAAILEDQLVLHHQPLIEVATGSIVGSESLVRWKHPRRGLIPPAEFIELAEVSGQMRSLTRWVIRQALSDLAQLGELGSGLSTSCNLSIRNLYEPDLTSWLESTLLRVDVAPHRLALEITETTIMEDPRTAREVLGGLRDLGVRVWIDDFGTGHSSFARLRSLPVDGVKIDRSFVQGSSRDETDRIVLRSLIELVHSLGLTVVAEGVEDRTALEFLGAHGCDYAQGFHIARPVALADLAEIVKGSAPDLRATHLRSA